MASSSLIGACKPTKGPTDDLLTKGPTDDLLHFEAVSLITGGHSQQNPPPPL